MILLDSNSIIYLSKGLIDIDTLLHDNEHFAISVITYMEVLGYPFISSEEEQVILTLLSCFEIIYISESIVLRVIELRKKYKIKLPDAIICATAMSADALLVTGDIRLKNIDDLKINTIKVS